MSGSNVPKNPCGDPPAGRGGSADRGSGCTGTTFGLTCDVAWITPDTSTNVTIWGTVTQGGELDATATATSLLEPELNPADNTTTLKLVPPLAATGSGSAGTTLIALAPPKISGRPETGYTLYGSAPKWNLQPSRVSYQWQLCTTTGCTAIKGATKQSLHLVHADIGKTVRLVATGTKNGHLTKTYSKKVAIHKKA